MSSSDEVRPAARSAGPLDRIEAALAWRDQKGGLWVNLTPEERDALVNVAKAAEDVIANEILVRYDNAADPMWKLNEALAALDKID